MTTRAGFTGTAAAKTIYPGIEARRLINATKLALLPDSIEPRPGVITQPGALKVTPKAGMEVEISAGYAVVPGPGGYVVFVDTPVTVTLPPSTTTPRHDLILIRVRDTEAGDVTSEAVVTFEQGVTTIDPVLPSPRCLVLARVLVAASVTAIGSDAIADRRVWTAAAGAPIPIPGAASSTPAAVNVAVGQEVWDGVARVLLVATTPTAWARLSEPGRVWLSQLTSTVLVGVSTSTGVLFVNLPADAPAGKYNIDADMVSLSDASGVDTFVQVTVGGGAWLEGGSAAVRNPASNPPAVSATRHVAHTITHAGGPLSILLSLQINGGTAPYNRSMPGTSLRVTHVGRA